MISKCDNVTMQLPLSSNISLPLSFVFPPTFSCIVAFVTLSLDLVFSAFYWGINALKS